eukprot:COSAG02_NODE_3209_length_7165_cov_31.071752_11_plen_49_part_00
MPKDEFVPFDFEVGGALGAKAERFLAECVRVAEWKNQGSITSLAVHLG